MMILRPPISTLVPYTTLFRSAGRHRRRVVATAERRAQRHVDDVHVVVDGPFDGVDGHIRRARAAEHANRVQVGLGRDRKSTRLNSSHPSISYAVFCLKKKNIQ